MDGIVHGVTKSQTRLNNFHIHITFILEEVQIMYSLLEMATEGEDIFLLPEKSFYLYKKV